MNVRSVLPRDAIPNVDDPSFGPSSFGDADDEVVVVEGQPPSASPKRFLIYHEVVNDAVGGRPLEFGVSDLLERRCRRPEGRRPAPRVQGLPHARRRRAGRVRPRDGDGVEAPLRRGHLG